MGISYHGGVTDEKNVGINIQINNLEQAKALLSGFGKSIKNVMDGVDFSPYLKEQLELIKDLEKAYAEFEKQQNSPNAASSFIRTLNALKATGLEDFKAQFKDLDIEGMLERAGNAVERFGDRTMKIENANVFTVETIRQLREGLSLLESAGVKPLSFLKTIQTDSVAAQKTIDALNVKVTELESKLQFSDLTKIEELEADIKRLRDSVVSQFTGWLEAAGFDKNEIGRAIKGAADSDAGKDMVRLLSEVTNGAKSVSQAVSKMGTKYASTIELMTGKPVGQVVGQADADAIQTINSRLNELTDKLANLKGEAQQGGDALHQVVEDSERSVSGVQNAVGSISPGSLKDILQLLKEIVAESSEFTEGVSASKNAAVSFLESLSSVGNIEADKLQNIAAALNSLRNIINPISQSKGSTSGLSSIAAFAERIDKLSRPANLSMLSGVNLQGFKEIGASKTLEYITNFISAVSTADLTGLKTLDDSLKSLGNVKISGNYAKLAAAISELNKLTSAKSKTFQNLQNLDLNKTFDISNVVGNADALKSMAESAEKYAEALRTISVLQKNVDKITSGASGTAIGERLAEIEEAKRNYAEMYSNGWERATQLPEYKAQMDAMWAQSERGAEALAEDLAQVEQKFDAIAESARNAEKAEEDALAASAAKETAAWDKAEDARYIKERAQAFNDLTKATKEAYKAKVEQAKYTGDDANRIRELKEYVRLTEEQLNTAKAKSDMYRNDADAAELVKQTEADLVAIGTEYSRVLEDISNKHAASKDAEVVRHNKERAAAFKELTNATKELKEAELARAKYTGADENTKAALDKSVTAAESQLRVAREKADVYRQDADAADVLAKSEADLAAIEADYSAKLDHVVETQEKAHAAAVANTASANQRAWEAASRALKLYTKELGDTTNQPVREMLHVLQEYVNELNSVRNQTDYNDTERQYYDKIRDAVYNIISALKEENEELQKVGGNASGLRELESVAKSVGDELSRVSKSITDWDNAFGKGNDYSSRAGEIQVALSKLTEEANKDGIAADDLRQRLSALKAAFAALNGEVQSKLAGGLFIKDATAQTAALNKIDVAISNLKKDMAGMGAARTGKTSENYKALEDSINQYEQLRIKVDECTISEDEFKQEFSNIAGSVRINTNAIKSAGEATGTFAQKLKSVAGVLQSWISPMRIIQYVIRTTRQMISTSIELDSAMTQLRVVTKASGDEMERFGTKAAASAKKIGASMTDLINSATTFARLGYSLDESAALAEYTTMLQNVGNIDVEAAQNAVTAIFKAFKDLDINDIESVMDRLVVVGNNFPISVSQIAEGMNNASSTLAAAGNSFEESVALLTAANTTIKLCRAA